jgi:hypothetical protein
VLDLPVLELALADVSLFDVDEEPDEPAEEDESPVDALP